MRRIDRSFIAARPNSPQRGNASAESREGLFRFFDLPPELRDNILRFALFDSDLTHRDVFRLFLTCHQMYAETAPLFYHEVVLDNRQLKGAADPFLAEPLTALSPRQFVRNLTIRFPREQIYLFGGSYGIALHWMAEKGNLRFLRLEMVTSWASTGSSVSIHDDYFVFDHIRLAPEKGDSNVILGPLFITRPPFQNFLKFLRESKIPKIRLYIDAESHPLFWCLFHPAPPSGRECRGCWGNEPRLLKIYLRTMFKNLSGAQHTPGYRPYPMYTPLAQQNPDP
ncbi:hypothetical protein AAE478_009668 [Parahypoxylon ruwenzoriense]